ncbi:MAG: aldose 1-epimerase family protein [Bacillota bacterium]|nr:aldose 1-epimerase family protein [Bacillota bacterium]
MKRSELFELRKRVGNLNALMGVTDYVLNDGPGKGVRVFHVRNGKGMELTVAADRGMDIPFLAYKGKTMSFAGKVGMRNPAFYDEDGVRGFLKQFYAGMLTTCGLTYAGAPCEDGGRKLGLHGPYSNLPASQVSAGVECEGDEVVIRLKGEVREACVFEENLLLRRTMTVYTEKDEIEIVDEIENQGFAEMPLMTLYHINFGYPMLDEGARVYTDAASVEPRDQWAAEGPGVWNLMDAPEIGRGEQCYFHRGFKEGLAMIHNEKLGCAGIVAFDKERFPILCEWKCMMAGEYALGLEPTMANVLGRVDAREKGILPTIQPGERITLKVRLIYTDDPEQIACYKKAMKG